MTTATETETTIRQELEIIRKAGGGVLRPAAVVAYAADPDTALHERFTWDDDDAACQYRLWQARVLIRVSVTVFSDDADPIRTYVSLVDDRQEEGGGYRMLINVLRNPKQRAKLLAQAKRDMEHFEQKYQQLTELADVFDAMKKARKRAS